MQALAHSRASIREWWATRKPLAPAPPLPTALAFALMILPSGLAVLYRWSFDASMLAVLPGAVVLFRAQIEHARRMGFKYSGELPRPTLAERALAWLPVLAVSALWIFPALYPGDAWVGAVLTVFFLVNELVQRLTWRRVARTTCGNRSVTPI